MSAVIPPLVHPRHLDPALQQTQIFAFQRVEWCIQHFPPWYHDDVMPAVDGTSTKDLPDPAFDAVALDSRADLAGRGHTKPPTTGLAREHEQHHELATKSATVVVYALELRALEEARALGELLAQRASLRPRPSAVSVPLLGAFSGQSGRSSLTCEHGSRGSSPSGACWADRYACLS